MADKTKKIKDAKVVKSVEELKAELIVRRNDLIEAQKGHKLGELTNPRRISTLRKEIACILTAINLAKTGRSEINDNKESK